MRCGDPTTDALASAFGAREVAEGWTLNIEREDVCPVVTLPAGADIDGFLATLGKKQRHEIRRKVRRAEAVGEIRLEDSLDPLADLEAFIELHQKRWGELGLFPDTPGGEQSRVFARRLFELYGADGPLRLTFLSVGARTIAAGIHFETPDGYLYYNAGVDPDARDLSPGVLTIYAYVARALESRETSSGLPAWERALQVRVGRGRRADPARCSSGAGTAEMAPLTFDPCLETVPRPTLAGGRRIRVVEVLATGTSGGAQEHLLSLVTRLDTTRYDVSVVALSAGVTVRKLQKAEIPVLVIDDPDDTIAVGALAAHLAEVRADVVHAHMYRAETVATRAVIALGEAGQRRPYLVATIHSSRIRSAEDQQHLRELTPHMDRLIAVSKAIEHKLVDEQRCAAPVTLVYNGVDLDRYDNQEACCTLPEEYGMEPGSQIVGVVARLEPEKGHPTLLEAWPKVLRAVPDAYLLIVGEGSRRDALEAQARELRIAHRVVFTGRRDDVPAVTAALDVAVLPRTARRRAWSSSRRWRCRDRWSPRTSAGSPR